MKQILNQLEFIKVAIEINDTKKLKVEIENLKNIDVDDDIQLIIANLENTNYKQVVIDIDIYLSKSKKTIMKYKDTNLEALKKELKKLEVNLQSLKSEKNEYLKDIEDFNIEYNLHLGDLIEAILQLKKEILRKKAIKQKNSYNENKKLFNDTIKTISEIKKTLLDLEYTLSITNKDDPNYNKILKVYQELQKELDNLMESLDTQEEELENLQNEFENKTFREYQSTKTNYEDFHNKYKNIKNNEGDSFIISNDEKKELKKLWKKASKLCHPDIVASELKDVANEIIKSLNEAYDKKDIEQIKKILFELENGIIFDIKSDSLNDEKLLKIKIEEFDQNIVEITSEIEDIKSNSTFILISSLNNWDEYFDKLMVKLEKEKKDFEKTIINILREEKEMFNFYHFSKYILTVKNQNNFEKYLESYFVEIEEFFIKLELTDIKDLQFDLEIILNYLIDNSLVKQKNNNIVDAFLILLAEQLEQINSVTSIQIIFDYLQESAVKDRLRASNLYLNNANLMTQYSNNFTNILDLILASENKNGYRHKTINAILNYYLTTINQFLKVSNSDNLIQDFRNLFIENQSKYEILNDSLIKNVVSKVTTDNHSNSIEIIDTGVEDIDSCVVNQDILDIVIEVSQYSEKLYTINKPNFTKIKQVSFDYIKSIGDPSELHTRLNQGVIIIDDEQLLYKYMVSYGAMHKAKLYESFETIIGNLNNITINIIDWGCGQALATVLLIEYIKEHSLQIDIQNITLIEPSKLALSRGLLHIDVTKQQNHTVKVINKDLDCIEQSDIEFDNNNVVLHLFSNILDVEFFKLDSTFLEKTSKNIQSDNYFVCVSPNINAKRNGRLDIFYKYFDENFNTELISARDANIGKYKRYEKVFKVKYITEEEVVEVREEIKDYHVDIYVKLAKYASILEPTLNTQRLKENIENDPDYVIFKIRKVAEIITSKIFMNNGGEDESRVSQNDKIRYLSFEKKILSRKAQSHLHTIRTIGNIGTHDHIENPAKMLKDDAYFLSTALILLIEDLQENNIYK